MTGVQTCALPIWKAGWLPSEADGAFIRSLMRQVVEPGKIAGWIAPPGRGVDHLPADYAYVKFH